MVAVFPSRAGSILTQQREIAARLRTARRIAVLGIKPESQPSQPAFYVSEYLVRAGLEVIPVPVYFPDVHLILGRHVYRSLRDVPGPLDIVVMFRRAEHIAAHVEDLIAKHPSLVWFQLGIRNDVAAQRLARAGIDVVQDRCIMMDHRHLAA